MIPLPLLVAASRSRSDSFSRRFRPPSSRERCLTPLRHRLRRRLRLAKTRRTNSRSSRIPAFHLARQLRHLLSPLSRRKRHLASQVLVPLPLKAAVRASRGRRRRLVASVTARREASGRVATSSARRRGCGSDGFSVAVRALVVVSEETLACSACFAGGELRAQVAVHVVELGAVHPAL